MLSAASYVGGRNVAVSMAQARNGGGSAAAHHRRLGIASGGFGAHCNWSEPDAGGAAVGVGGKVEMEV